MLELIARLLDTQGFPARWHCGTWSAALGWTHVVSDLAVWGAYTAIPLLLWFFVRRRSGTPFPIVIWLFGAFIFCCGTVHLLEAVIFWYPVYRLQALVKIATALVSWATVAALVPAIPRALALPGLADVNARLAAEAERRKAVEVELRERASVLERLNRVTMGRELRTAELKREVNELLVRLGQEPKYRAGEAVEAMEAAPADETTG